MIRREDEGGDTRLPPEPPTPEAPAPVPETFTPAPAPGTPPPIRRPPSRQRQRRNALGPDDVDTEASISDQSTNLPLALPGGSGGTFALPGSSGSVGFRTPNFYENRSVGPGSGRFGEGTPFSGGGSLDEGGVSEGGFSDDELFRQIGRRLRGSGGASGSGSVGTRY